MHKDMMSSLLPSNALKASPKASRRGFLLGASAASGALVVGFRPTGAAAQRMPGAAELSGYIRIGADNTVTILSAHMDMGQRIYHGIATLVNEGGRRRGQPKSVRQHHVGWCHSGHRRLVGHRIVL
jgi:isoquinoline 1-oxidoreductase subunit beta